ncbi:MAG TPA: HIT family protein [Nanoarchaeota archaeon]|nr:HIT family protein [Nanoarchaeota archaeon]
MADCIFCKIVQGEIPSAKFWEDKDFLAILDIFPNTKGMSLVLTKRHYDSYAFGLPDAVYLELMAASKKVAKLLEKALPVKRVSLVVEGMGVNHIHVKLYPMYGLKDKFEETWAKQEVFFDKYEGYISTQLGPKANFDELKRLAEKIRNFK